MVDRLMKLVMIENSDEVFVSSSKLFGNYYAISIAKLANQDWAINLESWTNTCKTRISNERLGAAGSIQQSRASHSMESFMRVYELDCYVKVKGSQKLPRLNRAQVMVCEPNEIFRHKRENIITIDGRDRMS